MAHLVNEGITLGGGMPWVAPLRTIFRCLMSDSRAGTGRRAGVTEQVPLTGQGRLREGGAEGGGVGSLLAGAQAQEESQIFCNQQQCSQDGRYLSPAPSPTPSVPPHCLHAASNGKKG